MRKRHRYVTVIVNGRHRPDPGDGRAPQQRSAVSVFDVNRATRWRRGSQSRRHRRVASTYKASVDACLRPRPPRAGPLPRHQMVLRRGSPQVRRDIQRREPHGVKPAFDPEVFRGPVLAAAAAATPSPAPTSARLDKPSLTRTRGSKPAGRPYRSSTASTLANDHQGALEALGRFCDLYRDRRAARVPRHRRHLHRMVRRDPGNWHHTDRPFQRTASREQTTCSKSCGAPPTASPTQRNFEARGILRDIHDPPTGASNPQSHEYAKGQFS